MAAFDQAAAAAILKTKYPKKKVNTLSFDKSPLLGMVPKDTDFGGDFKALPLRYGLPQGRSGQFSKAQANRTASAYSRFQLTRVEDFGTASVKGQTIKATQGDANALVQAITSETDGAIRNCAQSVSWNLYRNGSGVRAQIASTSNVATSSITVTNPSDTVGLEVGATIALSANNDGTGGVRSGTAVITGIQRATGTITFAAALNTFIPAAVNTDYISIDGDYGVMISGLDAWLVGDTVSATAFFGLNRQADTERLAGLLFDGTGGNIEEVLIEAAAVLNREGGSPDRLLMHPLDVSPLIKSMGTKREYADIKSTEPTIGYQGFQLMTEAGPVMVVTDRWCPKGSAYLLQMDTWELCSLGDIPQFLDLDGNRILREAGADAYEIRVGYYANLGCYAPGWNCKIKLA